MLQTLLEVLYYLILLHALNFLISSPRLNPLRDTHTNNNNQRRTHRLKNGKKLNGPIQELGTGGFGHVAQYQFEGENRLAAVKLPKTDDVQSSLVNELSMLCKAGSHRNIVKLIDKIEINNKTGIVLECMSHSLRDVLNSQIVISADFKLDVAIQIAKAIKHLHYRTLGLLQRTAIVHQDIKPENILFREEARGGIVAKLADFGCAREVDETRILFFGKIDQKVHEGHIAGTRLYMAPEVYRAIKEQNESFCEPKSDVFSYGLVLWELMTFHPLVRTKLERQEGRLDPFEADYRAYEALPNNRKASLPFPCYPASCFFGPVIKACLQPDITDRASAKTALNSLKAIERIYRSSMPCTAP